MSAEAAKESIIAVQKMPETAEGRRREYVVMQNTAAEMADKITRSEDEDKMTPRKSHKCAHLTPPLQKERNRRQQIQDKIHDSNAALRREIGESRMIARSECEWRKDIKK